ncbi:aspartate aminotransferase family protein [soil metagenome]
MSVSNLSRTETLDPQDWRAMRDLAHRMVDDAFAYLETVRERPAWQEVPAAVVQTFSDSVPLEPQGAERAYQDFKENVMPYPMGNIHPRFWAWYMGSGTVLGALGDFLAAVLNSNMGGGNHAAVLVEQQVIGWCKQMIHFPTDASGLMVSGASEANLIGLTVARNTQADADVRSEGVAAAPRPLVFYSSAEVHSCHQKAAELLGLGSRALHKVSVDSLYRIDVAALAAVVAADRAAGAKPFCVVGNAGTINTGAVDDLNALADFCEREGLWFHVDGAIGGFVSLSPQLEHLVSGIERADSVALDLHKWLHVPFEAGVALVRHEKAHRHTFSLTPDYLQHATRGVAGGELWFSDYGVQLSRGFKALKVWLSFKEHGVRKYGRLMEQNVAQAHYFAGLVEQEAGLELTAPVGLDIVCFRFNPGGLSDEALDALNKELLIRIHESGIAVPSYTTLNGRYCLRVAISNHRSTSQDFELFVRETVRLGEGLQGETPAVVTA